MEGLPAVSNIQDLTRRVQIADQQFTKAHATYTRHGGLEAAMSRQLSGLRARNAGDGALYRIKELQGSS